MSTPTKIAFLYSEIAGYTLACFRELAKSADILLIKWPVNEEAPFEFDFPENITVIDRKNYLVSDIQRELEEFKPQVIVCSGWMDKGYLKAIIAYKENIPKIVCIDNHWVGNLKQRIASLISPFYLKRIFSHAWVPGIPQKTFAEKLGFKKNILTGFYVADTEKFNEVYSNHLIGKQQNFPKRFLYLARYVEHKGIFEMWNAFVEWQKETPNEWELWCVGTGDEWENRVKHEKIKHLGFKQPDELADIIKETGIYVLPSKFEPWGVSVQEFAVAGYPMIISRAVGASTRFASTENSIIIEPGNIEELKLAFEAMANKSSEELQEMACKSHEIGLQLTPQIWTKTLLNLLKEWKN